VLYRLERTRVGLIWGSIREADSLSESIGINITNYKVLAFAIGCFFAGLAGAFWAHYLHMVSPGSFSLFMSINILVFMIVGGAGKFAGPILGAVLLTIVPEASRAVKEYEPIVFGAVLVLVMFLIPEGLIDLPGRIRYWIRRLWGMPKVEPEEEAVVGAELASANPSSGGQKVLTQEAERMQARKTGG
jgi:branched-chain amino acid transport system permease protein